MIKKVKDLFIKIKQRVGFQMIEILIIVAIVALLGAVVGPKVLSKGTAVQDSAFGSLDTALTEMGSPNPEG
jgi:type II secretory pathway pseudopilin PulG